MHYIIFHSYFSVCSSFHFSESDSLFPAHLLNDAVPHSPFISSHLTSLGTMFTSVVRTLHHMPPSCLTRELLACAFTCLLGRVAPFRCVVGPNSARLQVN